MRIFSLICIFLFMLSLGTVCQSSSQDFKDELDSHKNRIEELKKEIEISNRLFLKELGEIPTLFAYPYVEVDEIMFELLN